MLEGVVCNAEYASCRLNCPRAIPSYWREIWLERVEDPKPIASVLLTPKGLHDGRGEQHMVAQRWT
jgi:hypothetical protein